MWLTNSTYADDVAILAKKSAGENSGLELLAENLEDNPSFTTFHLCALA